MATMTLDKALLANAAKDPARVAVTDHTGKYTAAELTGGAFLFSRLLLQTTDKETVGVCLPSIKEYPLSVFAILLAGKTVVPLNFLLRPRELVHVLKDSGIDTIITCKLFEDKLKPLGVKLILVEDLAGMRPDGAPPKPEPAASPREVAVLLYTSGTTSLPKGVKLTHDNLTSQTEYLGAAFDLKHFHILSALPLFHTFALTVCIALPGITPARASYLPRFEPAETLEAMKATGANVMLAVPSMYRMLSRAAKKAGHNAKSLGMTIAVAGGEKLPADVRDEFEHVFGLPLMEGYGLTEHGPAVSVNRPGAHRPGTIGKALPGVEWRTVDESGKPQPVGGEGELQVRSRSVMAGYHNTKEQPFTADGWLITGDLARIDTDGFCTITGRIKELIIAAGKNIHPAEIEDAMREHEAVDECAAIAMPDKTRGEAPACFVVLKAGKTATPDELKDWLREKIADYKQPRLVKIVPELPKGPTGKVFKRGLKEMLPSDA